MGGMNRGGYGGYGNIGRYSTQTSPYGTGTNPWANSWMGGNLWNTPQRSWDWFGGQTPSQPTWGTSQNSWGVGWGGNTQGMQGMQGVPDPSSARGFSPFGNLFGNSWLDRLFAPGSLSGMFSNLSAPQFNPAFGVQVYQQPLSSFGIPSGPTETSSTQNSVAPNLSAPPFNPALGSQVYQQPLTFGASLPSTPGSPPAGGKNLGDLFTFIQATRPTFDYQIPTNMEGSYLAPGFAMPNESAGFSYVPSPEGVTPTWNSYLVMNPGGTLDVATMNKANTGWGSRTPVVGSPASIQIKSGLTPEEQATANRLLPTLQSASKPSMEAGIGNQFWGGFSGGPEGISKMPLPTFSSPSMPFTPGIATPLPFVGTVGANLPPGLTLPGSSGALGQVAANITRNPNAGWLTNTATGIIGAGLGLPGTILSLLNQGAGMAMTQSQNAEAVEAMNAVFSGGLPSRWTALNNVNVSRQFADLGNAIRAAEAQGIPGTYVLQLETAYGNKFAETVLNSANPIVAGLQGFGGQGVAGAPIWAGGQWWGQDPTTGALTPVGAGTGNPIPGTTDFGQVPPTFDNAIDAAIGGFGDTP